MVNLCPCTILLHMRINWDLSPTGLPPSSGVYGIFSRTINNDGTRGAEHLLYIGASRNMRKRVYNNHHVFDRANNKFPVYAKYIETSDYWRLEKELIKSLNPMLNKVRYA